MPENLSENAIIPSDNMPETAKEKFEREQLTRRQALKKFGMTSAMAAFALFSVDDLARMVGKAIQQRAGDNQVAEQVAKEFQSAGIAMAGGQSGSGSVPCQNCGTTKQNCLNQALTDFNACIASRQSTRSCNNSYDDEIKACRYSYASCCNLNNCNCGL